MGHELIVPLVHLNGTSKESLLELRSNAYAAINTAYGELKKMGPNGRDYYLKPGLMEQAIAQHQRRLQVLDDLLKEIEAECMAIDQQ